MSLVNRMLLAAAATAFSAGLAAASTLVVDRGLPSENLNAAAGADRSNVAWGSEGFQTPGDIAYGDSFSLGPTGSASRPGWRIDRLTAWFIAGAADDDNFQIENRFSGLSLYLGPEGPTGSTIDRVATTSITGNSADDTSVAITPVTYAGGAAYQASGGGFLQIWQLDFFDLGLMLSPGDYMFGIGADHVATDINDTVPFFLHASNAALGGVPADGADDLYLDFDVLSGGTTLGLFAIYDSQGFGWDKSSDINVKVWATPIPVPAALPLLAGGLALMGFMGWRQRRNA